jgi:zinc transporter ZupT
VYLLTAPLWGIFIKKTKSENAAFLASLIASLGYITLYLLIDSMPSLFLFLIALSALGGMGVVISSSSVLSEISEDHNRSAYATIFSISGAIGILFLSQFGGFSIDKISTKFPLLITGLANLATALVIIASKSGYLFQ